MNYKILILIILISIVSPAYSQLSNFKIIDSLINEHIASIKPELLNEKKRCFNLETNLSEIDFIIESKLLEKFPEFSFHKNRENHCPKLKINTVNISVNYKLLDDDNVERVIFVKTNAIIESNEEPLKQIHNATLQHKDQIKLYEINNLQKSPYSFDKGNIPEETNSFYDNYLQPIIFIGTAIITIAILFTVRSS